MVRSREQTIKIILMNKQKIGEIHKRQWDMAKQNFEYFDKRYSEYKQEIKALEDELAQLQKKYDEPIKDVKLEDPKLIENSGISKDGKESWSLWKPISNLTDLTDREKNIRDVLSIINGRIILIETKRTGKKKLDPLQEYFFLIWNDKKTNCIMVDSVENLKYKLNFLFDESH